MFSIMSKESNVFENIFFCQVLVRKQGKITIYSENNLFISLNASRITSFFCEMSCYLITIK